ncbi:phospholipid scramblase 2-like isoform X2 [Chrysoperla carnea]|uniref:phospholipid scramblase 2-like isoform X2 n=1 Tax=Chrysoperla carnea TaxID=189513 RepID=UPI001D0699D8|nr:phospholipid scramblase 2-like isoform X2 [Chrysoperla carnea]
MDEELSRQIDEREIQSSRADRERIRQALASQISSSTESFPGTRRPIPVSTIEWQSTNLTQMIPMSGLDFLGGVEQVCIQQTVDLNELLSNQESENLYTIKIPHGETLYLASESSTSCHRTFFGSNRAFSLRVYDHTRQEAFQLRRRLASSCCLFGCFLQKVEVWIPPGDIIGTIEQNWSITSTSFTVVNSVGNAIYHIEGPTNVCPCVTLTESNFSVLSSDRQSIVGSIKHQWDHILVGYTLVVNFPERNLNVKHKALLIGAAFLLEYMLFLQTRKCSIRC